MGNELNQFSKEMILALKPRMATEAKVIRPRPDTHKAKD